MARDSIHKAVKNALINDGWIITADPYQIKYKDVGVYADLAADRPIAAEKAGQQIVVEVKSFIGQSLITDLYAALGQYLFYRQLLEATAPERRLWLAISDLVWNDFFQLEAVQDVVHRNSLAILVVNTEAEEVVLWIN
jgi:hypothetical protein